MRGKSVGQVPDKITMQTQNKKNGFQTCIFDFDGVIVDSEPLHAMAKQNTLDNFQIKYPSTLFAEFKGRTDRDFFEYVSQELAEGKATFEEMDTYKRQVYLKLFESVPLMQGIQDFVSFARKRFNKLGLATSATARDFSLAAQRYPLQTWFDVIITGSDTVRHKPDPEPYLRAMSMLSVTGYETLVIEDSPNGIKSAKAANCTVVAITTSFKAGELRQAGADMIVASFSEIEQQLRAS
jgi:beta-phosphoglucomutase